MGMYIFD